MKKYYFFISLFLIAIASLHAQITLTSSNAPAPADARTYAYADTVGVGAAIATTGANVTWNLSALTTTTVTFTTNYIDPSTTPYASSFSGETVAQGVSGSYSYYAVTSSDYSYLGNNNGSTTRLFSDPEKLLIFPFTYNSSYTDNFAATVAGGLPGSVSGTVSGNGDAHGTLVLPSVTYNNTLRVKLIENTVEVVTGIITFYFDYTNYYWYDGSFDEPIVHIQDYSTYTSFNPTPTKTRSVYILPAALTGVKRVDQKKLGVNVFPNPTNGNNLNVSCNLTDNSDVLVSIYNSLGQEVFNTIYKNEPAGLSTQLLDVNGLSKGIYTVKIQSGNLVTCKKVTVEN